MFRKFTSVTKRALDRDLQVNKWRKSYFSTVQNLCQTNYTAEEAKQTGASSKNYGGSGRFRMRAWEIHTYSKPADLQLTLTAKYPVIRNPTDVIVNVKASSVNPIDVMMTKGYGAGTINLLRQLDSPSMCERPASILSALDPSGHSQESFIEFPLTLGRDFAGVVTEVGSDVKHLRIGDEVLGALGVQRNGSHADFVLTSADLVAKKPKNLSFVEAASLPYVGLTAWSAIHVTGGYCQLNGKKFLVLGGSGGIGTYVIQYLRASGAHVVSTCSPDAIQLLSEIGCHFAVDYKDKDYLSYIQQQAPFDCILDLSGNNRQDDMLKFLKSGKGQYITLSPPFISNADKYGLVGGAFTNITDIILANLNSFQKNQVPTKWAFFIPFSRALETLVTLAESGKVKPVIQEVFQFDDFPKAYEKLELGHARGKIAVEFT